jgi:2-keto-4-pentenoate hydratase/2-oxohepta-3-ene-1,7-dioic acid hydratase in catechol pathway
MKFATFSVEGTWFYGAVAEDGMIALSPDFIQWPTLREVIENDGFSALEAAAEGRVVSHANGAFQYEIPVPKPEKIICVGVNYPDRNSEYKDGSGAPQYMSLFIRFARSFVGHDVPLTRPKASDQLDYEGEVVIVIGKGGRHIPAERALEHVAAVSISNEGSVRDWIRHAKFNVTQGKNFEGSGSIGPWLVPFKDPKQLLDIKLETRVNGEVCQSDRTSRMVFNHAAQIAYISTFTTLVPGDVIITGTPTGAGARFDPPRFLKPGDVVEVEVEGVGVLRNGVVDE